MSNHAFIAAAQTRGITIEHAKADGKIHRVPVEGRAKSDRSGWYVLHASSATRMYGAYGRWDDGREGDTWQDGGDTKPLTKSELAAIAEARANATKQREREQREAATTALAKWDNLPSVGASPYLQRKAVEALGVRFDGEYVYIPLRDIDNSLWSLQRIAPDGAKRFHAGGRIAGCFHLIGEAKENEVLIICEGYATGATLYQATGATVACAMNCHNIGAVADALRKRYPKVTLLICADDDARTERERGMNPGAQAAQEVATRLKCQWVKPHGLPEGATDFNDLAAIRGIDEVTLQLRAALDANKAVMNDATGKAEERAGNVNAREKPEVHRRQFDVDDSGVWFNGIDKEGKPATPIWVCSPLNITARTRDADNAEWGYLLEFVDPEGNPHTWAMPSRMLAGDGNEYRQHLLSLGLRIGTSGASREKLTYFIQTRNPEDLARCTDHAGWHHTADGHIFVLPERTIGESSERVIFQSGGAASNTFREAGTLADWKRRVAAPCVNNSRLIFAVSAAFAGATLNFTGMESGGFHFRGGSSSGKTTALRAAASVFGGADFMQRWRATDNALESMAAIHSDAILILDEIAQVDPKVIGECAYLLANGAGKARMGRTGTPRPSLKWRLLFLSAGEVGLADHMAEVGKRTKAGQEVRLADLPADAGKGLGLFEDLHGAANGAKFVNQLNANAAKVYGVAGVEFIKRVAQDPVGTATFLKTTMQAFMQALREQGAEGQAERVAGRFALVGAAGELATKWGITGWPEDMALQSAERCFRAWLTARGGTGNAEERDMIRQVVGYLERNGESRFTPWARAEKGDDHMPDTVNRAGFKRPSGQELDASIEYYVLPEVFKNDVCKGYAHSDVVKVLKRHGFIKTDEGRLTLSARLPTMGKTRCYLILPDIFGYESEGEASDTAAA